MIGRVLQALVIMLVFGLLSWFIYEESLAQRAEELERPDRREERRMRALERRMQDVEAEALRTRSCGNCRPVSWLVMGWPIPSLGHGLSYHQVPYPPAIPAAQICSISITAVFDGTPAFRAGVKLQHLSP
jgi:hypothetical protein